MATPTRVVLPFVPGAQRVTVTDVSAFPASYVTGGDTVTASDLGLSVVDFATCNVKIASAAAAANAVYTPSTNKLSLLTATAEVAATTNTSGVTVTVTAWGR